MVINPLQPESDTARWFADEVKPHEPVLRGYLHSVATITDIDDVVQETYLRIWRARTKSVIRSTRALLFTTARNVALDLFRRRAVAKAVSETEIDLRAIPDDAPLAPDVVNHAQELAMLDRAIATLPVRCREVVNLRRQNLSHREIAAGMGISKHTVEAQLTKALHRCEDFFAEQRLTK